MTSHLLQSTLFACIMGLATVALRGNRARTRHWLWLAASLKFLVPFSLLVALGGQVPRAARPASPPARLSIVMEDAALPPAPLAAPAAPPASRPARNPLPAIWICGSIAMLIRWRLRSRRAAAFLKGARIVGNVSGVPLLVSAAAMEPGVFGIFRPRLFLPDAVASRLAGAHMEAILAHELCHVRHRDNLAAALHMLVETLFWFHPLVWWIGARLVEERERACDEEVLQGGSAPEIYAASILDVCRLCLESPVPCVSGITGADLQKRIAGIMTWRAVRNLDPGRKLLLAGIATAAVSIPLFIGIVHAQKRDAPPLAFEVASVKMLAPPKGSPWPDGFSLTPKRSGGRITWVANPRLLVYYAFHVQSWQTTFPPELHGSFYAIDAKTEESATEDQIRLMVQSLLKERFRLAVRRQTTELNGYALVVVKNGPKIKEYKDSDAPPPQPDYFLPRPPELFQGRVIVSKEGELSALTGRRVTMAQLAEGLQPELHTFVLDQTGLSGKYFFGTKFVHPDNPRDVDGPSLFAALQELGLKLEKQKSPVEMLIVDHMEKVPVEN